MKFLALIGACFTLTLAACGSSGPGQTATGPVAEEAGEAKEATAERAPRPSRPAVMMSKAEIAKLPSLAIPRQSGPPPGHFEIVNLRKGTGPAVTKTSQVSVRFIEDTYPEARKGIQGGLSEGEVRWLSWPLGEASRGLQVGLPGMKVGGRRELIVPPKVAYPRWKPSWGYAPYVSVYVVDLLGVKRP